MEFNMTQVQATAVVSSYQGTLPAVMFGINPLEQCQIQFPDKPVQSPARPLQTHVLVNQYPQQTIQKQTAVAQPRLSVVLPQPVKTLVFFDLETTGLPSKYKRVSITEIALVAIDRAHFEKQDKAEFRVTQKLTLCLKPQASMHPMAIKKSGLDPVLLKDQGLFNQAQPAIRAFLSVLAQPVCLLAHNGDIFDFPVLMVTSMKCIPTIYLFVFVMRWYMPRAAGMWTMYLVYQGWHVATRSRLCAMCGLCYLLHLKRDAARWLPASRTPMHLTSCTSVSVDAVPMHTMLSRIALTS
nr:uncharacterized protein LOC119161062 isoform X2 [Rhipicephalus microplus]